MVPSPCPVGPLLLAAARHQPLGEVAGELIAPVGCNQSAVAVCLNRHEEVVIIRGFARVPRDRPSEVVTVDVVGCDGLKPNRPQGFLNRERRQAPRQVVVAQHHLDDSGVVGVTPDARIVFLLAEVTGTRVLLIIARHLPRPTARSSPEQEPAVALPGAELGRCARAV